MPQARDQNGYPVPGVFRHKPGYGQSVAYTGTAGTVATEFSTINASATLTSDGTIPDDGDTVTIGNKVYTFKTALTPTEGQVLINGSAENALINLKRAIDHTGTADTDYKCAAAHTQVEGGAITATTLAVNALVGGAAANAYALAASNVLLTWSSAFLAGGVDDARGTRFVRAMCTTAAFVRIGVAPTAVAGDYAMAANVPENFKVFPGEKISAIQVAAGGTLYVAELD